VLEASEGVSSQSVVRQVFGAVLKAPRKTRAMGVPDRRRQSGTPEVRSARVMRPGLVRELTNGLGVAQA
jgi:hypothetical protein